MVAPALLPDQSETDYGLTVTQTDLDDAAELIHATTAYTLAEHVDVRNVYTGNVRRAWAIVANRISNRTGDDGSDAIVSESQGDYSYSTSVDLAASQGLSMLSGVPNELLSITASWGSFSAEGERRSENAGGRVPPSYDDYGVPFY